MGMVLNIVAHLDFWAEALATFPTWDREGYVRLVRRYWEALEAL